MLAPHSQPGVRAEIPGYGRRSSTEVSQLSLLKAQKEGTGTATSSKGVSKDDRKYMYTLLLDI